MLSSIIGSLIIGLIVGAAARALMPGRDPMAASQLPCSQLVAQSLAV